MRCSIAGVGALALVRGPGDDFFLWLYVLLFGGSQGSRGPMISTLATLRYRGVNFGRIYGMISHRHGAGRLLRRLGRRPAARLHRRLCRGDDLLLPAALALAAASLGSEAGARERLATRLNG